MSRQGGWNTSEEDGLQPEPELASTTIRLGVPLLNADATPPSTPGPQGGAAGYGLGARVGHSGEVYEARSPRFEGRVAMKLYRRATGLGPAAAQAFAGDAARASSLRHPHIVHVIEAGSLRDGTPFMTMEYLNGRTLEEHLAGRGAFLATELLPLVRGAASALSAAHVAGLVHRELRPDNIFIAELPGYESGFVKVLDFGACHLTGAQALAGRVLGERAIHYFAPEQMGGGRTDDVDARADQFALAAIAYRMLSGTDPPLMHVSSGAAGRPGQELRSVMPLARRAPAVDAVVSKALSRFPEDRFESVALFLRAFEEALAGAALVATPGPARAEMVHPPGPAVGRREMAPARALVRERQSLTHQFFEEGDRQEAMRYKNARVEPELSQSGLDFDSFDRIPTRRTPLVAAVLVMLVGGGALAWWAGIRPPLSWRESPVWRGLHLPTGLFDQGEPAVSAPESAPISPPAPAVAEGTTAPPAPAVAEEIAAPVAPAAAPLPAAAGPPPATEAPPARAATTTDAPPNAADAESSAAVSPSERRSPPSSQRVAPRQKAPALRGYTWSEEKRRMVPSYERSEPWPRASESPPAPPFPPADTRPGPPPFNPQP